MGFRLVCAKLKRRETLTRGAVLCKTLPQTKGAIMSKGYVYILSNPAMPGLVKIGRTSGDPAARASALNQTGVPMPFALECAILFPDCIEAERQAHLYFHAFRVSNVREFFACSVDDARQFLEQYRQEVVECFVSEFLPESIVCDQYYSIDPSAIAIIGLLIGEHPFDVPPILEEVRCDDEAFDIAELRRRMKERRARNRNSGSELHLSVVN